MNFKYVSIEQYRESLKNKDLDDCWDNDISILMRSTQEVLEELPKELSLTKKLVQELEQQLKDNIC